MRAAATQAGSGEPQPLLRLRDLTLGVREANGALRLLVRSLDLSVGRGEIVSLVGESGSGKSLTALAVLGLLPPAIEVVGGTVFFEGDAVLDQSSNTEHKLTRLRGRHIGLVFQDPVQALNPCLRIGRQLHEVVHHHFGLEGRELEDRSTDLLLSVGLEQTVAGAFAHQLSGGQAQRAVIALALAGEPSLLIADEPTTALDSATQIVVLELLEGLRRKMGVAIILISHDLPVMAAWADRLVVVKEGVVVEAGPARDLYRGPRHPYTQRLIADAHLIGVRTGLAESHGKTRCHEPVLEIASEDREGDGLPDRKDNEGFGCPFLSACERRLPRCRHELPSLSTDGPGAAGRFLRCWNPLNSRELP